MANHVARAANLGASVLIRESWYYSFEAFNDAEELLVRPSFKMTAKDHRLWKFKIIEDTGEEVPNAWLDQSGRYDPERGEDTRLRSC